MERGLDLEPLEGFLQLYVEGGGFPAKVGPEFIHTNVLLYFNQENVV